jgi:hypothetical protein
VFPKEILRYGAYLCLRLGDARNRRALEAAAVPALAARLQLQNEFEALEPLPLAAEAGIACLMRRTYKTETEPAPEGAYDFVTYFECADADVPTFHRVAASLRDVDRNPEWRFVREGPTWHGRRVATWPELFAEGR